MKPIWNVLRKAGMFILIAAVVLLMLAERFHISHTTVQFEHASCGVSANGCVIPVSQGHYHQH